LAALYDRFGPPLYRLAWTMLGSRQDAEDAVQEVFLGLVRSRTTLQRVENLRAYLFAALRHMASRLTGRRRILGLPPEGSLAVASREERDIDAAPFGLLERGLAALPSEQREVLSLKIDGELTFAEIGEVLGTSPKTAASRYRYALEKLRGFLRTTEHEHRPASTRPT
jgi:RNA polymerase sigma-70 factor (ECF subfamily)